MSIFLHFHNYIPHYIRGCVSLKHQILKSIKFTFSLRLSHLAAHLYISRVLVKLTPEDPQTLKVLSVWHHKIFSQFSISLY